ncbi:HipA domain-containing protein [Hydrocarboniphaga sp.]|uniref:HipA domain-containing protein n=1 Tax=Hydrocarboniphaga sp. TaxID=2033016 RepID=UPI003D0F7907
MARALNVLAGDRQVGQLREQDDIWEFEYTAQWQASPEVFDLSPALSRRSLLHRDGSSQRPVQWYFDNLLPEEGLRTLLSNEAGIPEADAFGLLAHFGRESAGSLTLLRQGESEAGDHGRNELSQATLSQRIDRLPKAPINRDAPKRMSLAGAQHKLLVIYEDGALFEPVGGTPSTHLLKPNHPDAGYPASVLNEYFTMRLADRMRLRVPAVHRLRVPQPVYLIDRFDRVPDDGGRLFKRLHTVDACQLLNKSRAFKYTEASVETLNELIERCRSKASARQEIFRWLAFNVLIGNGDNHLKNLSFLVHPDGVELAPAYDLLSTAVYDTRAIADTEAKWPATHLALPLPGAATFGAVRRSHLVDAGRALNLPPRAIDRELDRMSAGLLAAADQLIAEIESETEAEVAQCPNPSAASEFVPNEMRLLSCIRGIVIQDMLRQVATA